MKKIFLNLAILLSQQFIGVVFAQNTTKAVYTRTVEGMKEYKLNNGLQIILIPDQSQSNVITNIVYRVGSKHEGYGEKGMAHLLEHMLFKSTRKLGDIKQLLSEKGGQVNGSTHFDRTNYYEIFPESDENLRWSIEMEADRMINATLKQEDLSKEFSVVRNEFEIAENDPSGSLRKKVISASFLWHNYGKTPIGSKEDIERVTTSQLRPFYEKYYQPDNAVLIIGGKFNETKALQYIEQYFSIIPRPGRKLDAISTIEPAQQGEKYVEMKRSGDTRHIGACYHTASYADKDYAALNALGFILNNNPSGYLFKALVTSKNVASFWQYQPLVRDPSFMYFSFDIPNNNNTDQVSQLIRTELDKIPFINYTQEDIDRSKAWLLKAFEEEQNNTINYVIGLTESVAAGDYRLGLLYRDNLEKLTLSDIQRVAKRYFLASNRTLGIFIPSNDKVQVKADEISDADLRKLTEHYKGKESPEPIAPFEASIANIKKNYSEGKISNGMKFSLINKQIKGNKVIANIVFRLSNEEELYDKQFIGLLTADLLTAGTKNMTMQAMYDKLNLLRSTVSFSFSGQNLTLNISSYRDSFEETMSLVHEMITNPVFPQTELDKMVLQYVTNYESKLNDPQAYAFTELERMTSNAPKTSIYYTYTCKESVEELKKIKQADLLAFYKNIMGADYAYASVIGLPDAKKVQDILEQTFGKWHNVSTFRKAYPIFIESKKKQKIINIPEKENATALGRINLNMTTSHPDYPALVFANEILGSGGFLTARIPLRLREKDGISYGAGSYLDIATDPKYRLGNWNWYAYLNPSKRTDVEQAMNEEISKILKDGVTESEMKAQKESWKNARQTLLGNDNNLLSLSLYNLLFGESFDTFDQLNRSIEKLSVHDINTVLRKYIDPNKLTTIYTGTFDAKK